METKRFFLQLKNFILSNNEVIDALNGNFTQEDWKEDIFYAVSNDFILKWEKYIGYKEICKELQKRGNKQLISDEDEEWCCSIIENNINKEKELTQSNIENINIYTTFFSTINLSIDDIKELICPNTSFYLISKKAWEYFNLNESEEFSGKISVKIGKNKILIKFEYNQIILLNLLNNKDGKIEPKNLQKYLNQYIISFDDLQDQNEINKLIDEIKNIDLIELEKEIKNNFLFIRDKRLSIQTKEALNFSLSLNVSSIYKKSISLNEEEMNNIENLRSIVTINNICQTIVLKVKFCSIL
jgi:hypothetical protein